MTEIQKILKLYKKEGKTPLEAILRFKKVNPQYKDLPMTYAGRLDPMAEGLLLVLSGEECKRKEEYLGLDKEYEVEVLFGVETDSFDTLGIVKSLKLKVEREINTEKIKKVLKTFVGKFEQEYPMFSSKTVKGKSLFAIAKSGQEIDEIPTKNVEIYGIKIGKMKKISTKKLFENIEKRISKVKGDFRQKAIISKWQKTLGKEVGYVQILPITVKCSSGTYMRSLAYNLGKKLNVPALAYRIRRTKIGRYNM